MIKQISKVAMITVVLLVILMVSSTPATVAASPQLAASPCQCVGFVTNTLFGKNNNGGYNNVYEGSWPNAMNLASQEYWNLAYKEYKYAGLYKQVKSPTTAQANDVIIMRSNALVYVQMTNGAWDYLTYVGNGSGHIGFVRSAKYYDKNFNMTSPKLSGLSGWLITMRSGNWGTKYNNGLADSVSNPNNLYSITSKFFELNGCTNVNDSLIFLPTGNPVSFWRK